MPACRVTTRAAIRPDTFAASASRPVAGEAASFLTSAAFDHCTSTANASSPFSISPPAISVAVTAFGTPSDCTTPILATVPTSSTVAKPTADCFPAFAATTSLTRHGVCARRVRLVPRAHCQLSGSPEHVGAVYTRDAAFGTFHAVVLANAAALVQAAAAARQLQPAVDASAVEMHILCLPPDHPTTPDAGRRLGEITVPNTVYELVVFTATDAVAQSLAAELAAARAWWPS